MKKTITKKFTFESSHRLIDTSLSEEENKRLYGKCYNYPNHGHSYKLFVTVSGKEKNGMIINFRDLKQIVNEEVIDVFDHHDLNELEYFDGIITTAENIIDTIWILLNHSLREVNVTLEKLKLYETETSCCEVSR